MIDKVTIGTLVVIGAGRVIAQVAGSDSVGLPSIGALSSMTSTGAIILLVVWLTTKSFPDMQAKNCETFDKMDARNGELHRSLWIEFRSEMALIRADRDKERERVVCKHQGNETR